MRIAHDSLRSYVNTACMHIRYCAHAHIPLRMRTAHATAHTPPLLTHYSRHALKTTIMAVQFDGGVIIGADSRTTMGSYIANRVTDKLTMIHDQVYCCRSGSAADTQAVADIVHYYCQMFQYDGGAVRLLCSFGRA